ncbi:MAG: hypothetical protein OMM_09978 [Candidatus Magnetoglobus multicellularis str. Araruama]|uniref:Uncharacterized protein n=1 Tax=Candidatus Magnetoglobus multicellularis str. Araruama TaxID=890399 RepID=A0A1V1P2F1_9BACT|nr:MAG: hypothetical protein OMM_09978 [Candidatus Magnetoglobus multicellularis str. Araruama]
MKTIRPPINPETGNRPPSTFLIWVSGVISIYVALFSIASQRYENRANVIENRANAVFAQLGIKDIRAETLSRISTIQNMSCPTKPIIFEPITVFKSLLSREEKYRDIVELMRDTLIIWKETLENVNLSNAYLPNSNLQDAKECSKNKFPNSGDMTLLI